MKSRAVTTATVFAALLTLGAWAQVPPPGTVVRPRRARSEPVVIPERFLRRWDPVTVFFPTPVGKPAGTTEHELARFVRLTPSHPVAAQWIDRSTLQIKPVDPWRPLERYTVQVGDRKVTLATLMPPPTESIPEDGAQDLPPIERIVLAFPAPIDPKLLARMVSIELRPLPGEGGGPAQWIDASGFRVKPLEGGGRGSRYALLLDPPIPGGTAATVHLRLSLDDDPDRSFVHIRMSTMAPFRIAKAGTSRIQLPLAPGGTRYSREQALDGGWDSTVVVDFTAPPAALGPLEARRLVRITPPVEWFESWSTRRELRIHGRFVPGTLYRVRLEPAPLTDTAGRTLEMAGASEFFVRFRESPPLLAWARSSGIVERFGPEMVPVSGRGHERLDLRIVPVDPADRSFWPFPRSPVRVDESKRPPGPGEVPGPYTEAQPIPRWELAQRLAALGSPAVSTIVELPLKRHGRQATFGLDLAPYLDRIRSAHAPGHYLAGLRALDKGTTREWMRLEVTDLSLTTVEGREQTAFVVTSLRDARPVAGARIDIEGPCPNGWSHLGTAVTDAEGRAVLGNSWRPRCSVQRVTVTAKSDVLVLAPDDFEQKFHDGSWVDGGGWLGRYLSFDVRERHPEPVAYLRTERPVYRPGEPVHILGYVRRRRNGRLEKPAVSHLAAVVTGPGETQWRYPVSLDEVAGFAVDFAESNLPTGRYTVHLEGRYRLSSWRSSETAFRIEAYRIPRFEVILHASDSVPLDAPFDVGLTARYYAGGGAAGRPVAWRVTQFPLEWSPPAMEGFVFSSDARYSTHPTFESTGRLERQDVTDEKGGARLTIDPTIEPTAAPRTYVVEATVTGADNQTVTSVRRVRALPPFVVGVSVPRFLEPGQPLRPKVVVLDREGKPLPGRKVEVELVEKQWHSYLRAQDFSTGSVRYVTDVVEKTASTTTVTSGRKPLTVPLAIPHAGVYVVRLTAHDRLGRAQTVAVDLYAAGDEPLGWEKPPKKTLRVSSDRDRYRPGDTAVLVVQSPFQEGRVLAVVEKPEGFTTMWLDVKGGTATLELPLQGNWAPAIPVHLILMRGRKPGTRPVPGTAVDLGKPETLAATKWIAVEPVASRAVLTVEAPHTALPGQSVTITLRLADAEGNPLSGRVALWLVDRAVLALGKERRLDPLRTFIRRAPSELDFHDSRNLVFGWIPFRESEGGGEGAQQKAEEELGKRVTVRRNFKPVAFYNPAIDIGADGKTEVRVKLPDNLTDWAIRAIAADFTLTRLGAATGVLSVRLPVIVQPALPRFARTGDRFSAAAVARVVEGPGGPGRVELAADGLETKGEASRAIDLVPNRPLRVEVPVTVPQPDPGLSHPEASFRAAVERRSDGARDAFEVKIPVLPDREPEVRATVKNLPAGKTTELEALPEGARPGSLERRLVISTYPGIVKMAAALDVLRRYPYGCTEQRIARARAYLAARRFRRLLALTDGNQGLEQAVKQTMVWLRQAVDDHGYAAYWPGSGGDVALTAWCTMFLEEAADAGFPVDRALEERMIDALERALRSDAVVYAAHRRGFVDRAWALAALARAGKPNRAYAAELVRRARYLDLESAALVLRVLADHLNLVAYAFTEQLVQRIEGGVLVTLQNGKEVYRGIDQDFSVFNPLILPSETRTLAEMTRALHRAAPASAKLPLMVAALVRLGSGDGWGSTNADAAATLALAELLQGGGPGGTATVELEYGGRTTLVTVGPSEPVALVRLETAGPVRLAAGPEAPQLAVMERCRWLPAAPGSRAERQAHGFVVSREALLVNEENGVPPKKVPLSEPGGVLELSVGQVVEEHVEVVNPEKRHYVAISVPLAAGMEILNPNLATAPPEARPTGRPTLEPTFTELLDDRAVFYYTTLPAGTYHLYVRTRATTPGRFTQPAARAEAMYDAAVYGSGFGAEVVVRPREGEQEQPR